LLAGAGAILMPCFLYFRYTLPSHYTMTLHREGRLIIPIASLIVVLLLVVIYDMCSGTLLGSTMLAHGLALTSVVFLLLILNFFRVPKRNPPQGSQWVLAPCNGKVVVIEEIMETSYFRDKRIQVSIFMSPLDVHVNYAPISGTFLEMQYRPGKYLVAWHPKSSAENEQTFAVMQSDANPDVKVAFKQIAGALARRIKWYVKPGDRRNAGEEFGFIRFGSRVDVLLPVGTEIKVKLGDRTTGAQTVIAQL
jgi:phosphatidylserine decarboxylase